MTATPEPIEIRARNQILKSLTELMENYDSLQKELRNPKVTAKLGQDNFSVSSLGPLSKS